MCACNIDIHAQVSTTTNILRDQLIITASATYQKQLNLAGNISM